MANIIDKQRGHLIQRATFCAWALPTRSPVTNTGCTGSTRVLAVRPWRTQGCLLYLVALLHLPSFFRFDVLV
jgi:hypothetical protein